MISTKTRMMMMMMMMMMIAIFGSETKHLCGCVLLTMSSRYPSVPEELPPMPAFARGAGFFSPARSSQIGECEAAKESANQQTVLHRPIKDDAKSDRRFEIEQFHLLCYGGFTVQARRLVAKNPWLLWATSYSFIAHTCVRATDFCRLGKNHGFQTEDLLQHLERLEDKFLSSNCNAVCQPRRRQCASLGNAPGTSGCIVSS